MALPNTDQSARAVRRRQQKAAKRLIARRYLIPMAQAKDRAEDAVLKHRLRYARLSYERLTQLAERAVEKGTLKRVEDPKTPDVDDPALD